MLDWGLGRYEHTAAQLLPAAVAVIEAAAPASGERVVDVGCGTGNAALLAAARGARVTGVDPAQRLLEVARAEAATRGLDATFVQGEAAAIPLDDASANLLVSVFAVIFALDARAAAAEMARVVAPGGRMVLSGWLPQGAMFEATRAGRDAIGRAVGGPDGAPPFPWHDRVALADLLAPHGFEVAIDLRRLAFTAPSVREFLDAEMANHPLSVAGRAILEPRGEAQAVYETMREVFEAANEDPSAFRATSDYVVATARRR
jgi:ubiquinone/menaquinone biosynthesis C-methylase UbiE